MSGQDMMLKVEVKTGTNGHPPLLENLAQVDIFNSSLG